MVGESKLAALLLAVAACGSSGNIAASDGGADGATVDASDAGDDAGDAAADPWSCVGHVRYDAPAKQTVDVTFALYDVPQGTPAPGVEVRACPDPVDPACTISLATQTTGADGKTKFTLPTGTRGFDGYFEATRLNDVTSLYFWSVPFWADAEDGRLLWSGPTLQSILTTAGVHPDPQRGIIGIQAHDCRALALKNIFPDGMPSLAAGIAYLLEPPGDAMTKVGYFVGNTLDLNATETNVADMALGGFVNVPPGIYTVSGKRVATGQIVSKMQVVVRAGLLTNVALFPTP